jgi:cell division protein FtsB
MVTRKRLRAILTALGLYLGAVAFIGYFAINAYTGNHGLKVKKGLEAEIAELSGELAELRQARVEWEQRLTLLRSHSLDPDMLDERARILLGYVHPHDVVMSITDN